MTDDLHAAASDFLAGLPALLDAHPRAALQFSGGKDSLACLYLLRPFLDRITVYWTNPGDAYPETLDVVEQVKTWVPHFVEIRTDVQAWRAINGMPSDIIPTSTTPMAVSAGENDFTLTDRLYCCYSNIMQPMHARMIADACTLIIRGVKKADTLQVPTRDRTQLDGFTFCYPLDDWTDEDVMAFLREQNAPISRTYDFLEGCPDCLHCSAWWKESRGEYLKLFHPEAHAVYTNNLKLIGEVVNGHIAYLLNEVS